MAVASLVRLHLVAEKLDAAFDLVVELISLLRLFFERHDLFLQVLLLHKPVHLLLLVLVDLRVVHRRLEVPASRKRSAGEKECERASESVSE